MNATLEPLGLVLDELRAGLEAEREINLGARLCLDSVTNAVTAAVDEARDKLRALVLSAHGIEGEPDRPVAVRIGGAIIAVVPEEGEPSKVAMIEPHDVIDFAP